jgi:hypothetical protein
MGGSESGTRLEVLAQGLRDSAVRGAVSERIVVEHSSRNGRKAS